MSALLQTPKLHVSLRRLSEGEAIQSVGRAAQSAPDAASGLESLAGIALRLPGLDGVEMNLLGEAFAWYSSRRATPKGSAQAIVCANGREWGRMRILFEPRIQSVACPLQFVRFLAQQSALLLGRIEAVTQYEELVQRVSSLQKRLDTRKAVHRASGMLAQERCISERAALAELLKRARSARKPLFVIAQAIIFKTPPLLRRLAPHETTPAWAATFE